MLEFVENAFKLSNAHWFMIIAIAGSGYVVLWWSLDSHGPAILAAPFMVLGAVFSNQLLNHFDVQLSDDRVVNSSIGIGIGVFLSSFLIILILWTITVMATPHPKSDQK